MQLSRRIQQGVPWRKKHGIARTNPRHKTAVSYELFGVVSGRELRQICAFLSAIGRNRPAEPEEVPSSYWHYEGNRSFFCVIFHDITRL
jgi:hypothetical protein